MDEVLSNLNRLIREEHGQPVAIDNMWTDADVDSFGTTIVFLEMDELYKCYSTEWFKSMTNLDWESLTIRELVERVTNESTKL